VAERHPVLFHQHGKSRQGAVVRVHAQLGQSTHLANNGSTHSPPWTMTNTSYMSFTSGIRHVTTGRRGGGKGGTGGCQGDSVG
jgi:hypothetical protein